MALLDLIFPARCAHCLGILRRGACCIRCLQKTQLNRTLFCGSCRARLPGAAPVCHPAFPYMLGAAAEYGGPVKSLVRALKFSLVEDAADELAGLLLVYAAETPLNWPDYSVTAVPLSRRRMLARGFNQAELLAARFARGFRLHFLPSALTRIRETPPQSLTGSVAERERNVTGAFRAEESLVYGRKIILVDDVVTSGATLAAAAAALKSAGAKKVVALVAAKRS